MGVGAGEYRSALCIGGARRAVTATIKRGKEVRIEKVLVAGRIDDCTSLRITRIEVTDRPLLIVIRGMVLIAHPVGNCQIAPYPPLVLHVQAIVGRLGIIFWNESVVCGQ